MRPGLRELPSCRRELKASACERHACVRCLRLATLCVNLSEVSSQPAVDGELAGRRMAQAGVLGGADPVLDPGMRPVAGLQCGRSEACEGRSTASGAAS